MEMWYNSTINSHPGSFSVSKWHVTRKQLALERNEMKFGLCGRCHMTIGYLWHFRVQGHFEVIRCTYLKMNCNSKTAGVGRKGVQFLFRNFTHGNEWTAQLLLSPF